MKECETCLWHDEDKNPPCVFDARPDGCTVYEPAEDEPECDGSCSI